LYTVFHAEFADMFMSYLHTIFHVLSFNDLLVTTFEPKNKYRLHAAAMLLFYIPQSYLN